MELFNHSLEQGLSITRAGQCSSLLAKLAEYGNYAVMEGGLLNFRVCRETPIQMRLSPHMNLDLLAVSELSNPCQLVLMGIGGHDENPSSWLVFVPRHVERLLDLALSSITMTPGETAREKLQLKNYVWIVRFITNYHVNTAVPTLTTKYFHVPRLDLEHGNKKCFHDSIEVVTFHRLPVNSVAVQVSTEAHELESDMDIGAKSCESKKFKEACSHLIRGIYVAWFVGFFSLGLRVPSCW
ncbi:hypothetical protein ACU18_15425 [Arthrobacter sp. ZBG10]|nr:hypothetical protein ACU18_15425 [Arthrobacter sp. ZBG10]